MGMGRNCLVPAPNSYGIPYPALAGNPFSGAAWMGRHGPRTGLLFWLSHPDPGDQTVGRDGVRGRLAVEGRQLEILMASLSASG